MSYCHSLPNNHFRIQIQQKENVKITRLPDTQQILFLILHVQYRYLF